MRSATLLVGQMRGGLAQRVSKDLAICLPLHETIVHSRKRDVGPEPPIDQPRRDVHRNREIAA